MMLLLILVKSGVLAFGLFFFDIQVGGVSYPKVLPSFVFSLVT